MIIKYTVKLKSTTGKPLPDFGLCPGVIGFQEYLYDDSTDPSLNVHDILDTNSRNVLENFILVEAEFLEDSKVVATRKIVIGETRMKYRKKPIEPTVVEAKQFLNDSSSYELLHWINTVQHKNDRPFVSWVNDHLIIPTLEGDVVASVGDWIICGIDEEFYPCKNEIFVKTYEIDFEKSGSIATKLRL